MIAQLLAFACCLSAGAFLAMVSVRVVNTGIYLKRFTLRELMGVVAVVAVMLWIFLIIGALWR
jgi:hypothetical protein